MACSEDTVMMPLDASGRNRPSSVNGETLSWDAAGNMVRRGGEYFFYDHRNRLIRITDGPNLAEAVTLAVYEYDAFDRRVAKVVGGVRTETVWADWQPIEEYRGANLVSRRTYGLGLDEIVALELDVTGNGVIDGEFIPIYDTLGNVAMVTMPDGTPVERYEYSPYGDRWVIVDSTAPEIEQVRVVGAEVWVELSEEVLLDPIKDAIDASLVTLTWLSEGQDLPLAVAQPVAMGPEAGRRLVFTLTGDPATWPVSGDSVGFRLPAAVLFDTFGNEGASGVAQVFPWAAGSSVLEDHADPRLDQVCVLTDGRVELVFSEPLDGSRLAGEIAVGGQSVSWLAAPDQYTLTTTEPLVEGSYSLTIGAGPLELVGRGLAAPVVETIDVIEGARKLVYLRPTDGVLTASTIGNPFGFHGLSMDLESGFYYARHRYYDPGMGRFTSTDPMGYADGPSMYQYALNNPVNYSDPTGELVGVDNAAGAVFSVLTGLGFAGAEFAFTGQWNYGWADVGIDAGLGFATSGLSSLAKVRNVARIGRAAMRVGAEAGIDVGAEALRHELRGEDYTLGELARGAAVNFVIGEAGAAFAHRSRSIRGSWRTANSAVPQVLRNQAAGNAARDAISAARPGSLIEQNFRVTGGLRRVDVLDGVTAIESKVGRTSLTAPVRQELARDIKMLRSGQVDAVQWHFSPSPATGLGGPTGPLRAKLDKFGIPIVE
jgi:RHS repeat-associated protein